MHALRHVRFADRRQVCDRDTRVMRVRFSPLQLMALSTTVSAPDLDSGDASLARIFDPCAWNLSHDVTGASHNGECTGL